MQHTDGLFLLDPAGRERMADEVMANDGGRLSPGLRNLLSAQGRRDLAAPQTPWTPAEVLGDLNRLRGRAAGLGPVPGLAPPTRGAVRRLLAGSPRALAELPVRAGQLLGSERSLAARIRALRDYPIVLNAWASWCGPCRGEFPIFAAASARYGRRVAFLPTTIFIDPAGRVVDVHTGQFGTPGSLADDIARYATVAEAQRRG